MLLFKTNKITRSLNSLLDTHLFFITSILYKLKETTHNYFFYQLYKKEIIRKQILNILIQDA